MPKLLRPREEFPTPLFRAFVAVAAPVLGGLPGWIAFPGWESPRPYLVILGLACLIAAGLVASAGSTPRAGLIGAAAILLVVLGEYVVYRYSQLD